MTYYSWKQEVSNFGSNSVGLWNKFGGNWESGLISKSQSLVLDEEKGELVKAHGRVGKKGGLSEVKAIAAMKSHSEAEKRRRERINAHLDTLRGLVPCTDKMDKATLLAEVISQVKLLNSTATQASEGLLIPKDADEVRVETLNEAADDGSCTFRASLCCDSRPELLSDLRQTLDALDINIVRLEISTFRGRVKSVFDFTSKGESSGGSGSGSGKAGEALVGSVREALNSILEKVSFSPEYSPRTTLPNKRRRYSVFENSSSPSLEHQSCG